MCPQRFRMTSGVDGSGARRASAPSGIPWLLKAKVLAPEPPAGYVGRASSLQHLDEVLERRLTVLQAPAGFGKTTVLADVVRRRRKQGIVVAWVSLDDDDTPNLFGSYLAYAFEHAGLEPDLFRAHDAWASSPGVQQIGMLARAIEQHESPCLLVLDEVDRLPRRTVQLVHLLLRRAPRNLHVALAFRVNPGFELATYLLAGGAVVVDAEALRFSPEEIARFFGGSLAQAELAALEERTAGWPVALTIHRSTRASEGNLLGAGAAQITRNYISMRLLSDLSQQDRVCLLDLAVFDWIDAELVDEVLGSSAARLRVVSLSALQGLLPPVDPGGTVRRLHPLLRDHCLHVLSVEAPDRKRFLHKGIAQALARRGQLTLSWRHARAAGDSRLVGELIERDGACRLWLREGVTRLISAGRFLTPEITELYPRLDLLNCLILCLSFRWREAAARFEAISHRTDGFARDRAGGDAGALALDRVFTQAALTGGADGLLPADLAARLPAGSPGDAEGRTLVCARHTLLCIACYERASFEESGRHGLLAQAHAGEDTRFGAVFVDTCLGMAAMAQGRVEEAGRRYRQARRVAREYFAADPCLTLSTDVLMIELDLERNREKTIQPRTLKNMAELRGVWVDVYSTAVAVSAELMLGQYDPQAVIELLSTAVDGARETGIESFRNHMSALLANYLSEVGCADDAGQVWGDHGLPCDVSDLLDLERQSWRTMEALSCVRVRLLAEQGEWAAAEALAAGLCAVASKRGLTRTLLRGLALSMDVAYRAGRSDRALDCMVDFLRAVRGTDYVRPLVRHRSVSRTVLRRLLATDLDEELRATGESMQTGVGGPETGDSPLFSTRELEVLSEAARGLRNREIAGRLGITNEGVRYHLKNIYRKAHVATRVEAVRYAASLGVLS